MEIDSHVIFESPLIQEIPVVYKGRFRPLNVYSRLWLFDIYHHQTIKKSQRQAFKIPDGSAQELIWKMHFLGHQPWDDAPIFWIHYADLKQLLGLDPKADAFSYNLLWQKIYQDKQFSLPLLRRLAIYSFFKNFYDPFNRSGSEKQELTQLAAGLWAGFNGTDIVIMESPKELPWAYLEKGMILLKDAREHIEDVQRNDRALVEESMSLMHSLSEYEKLDSSVSKLNLAVGEAVKDFKSSSMSSQDIALSLEMQMPLVSRLQQAGTTIKALPGKNGEWYSLHALRTQVYDPSQQKLVPVGNFTAYSDEQFTKIRRAYDDLEGALDSVKEGKVQQMAGRLASLLLGGYSSIAQTSYKQASGKNLDYPSIWQLKAELYFYSYPLVEICITLYGLALIAFIFAATTKNAGVYKWALGFTLLGFFLHTVILAMRCYILNRPPVSNMFETVIYVPWIAVLASFFLGYIYRSYFVLIGSCTASMALLIVLKLTNVSSSMENVQAVLDSQYWLIIHVLMVVGSYGLFILSGVLGHFYLISDVFNKQETDQMKFLAQLILQSMYIGVALLIPGTILGGVWAAESWGRFWDWDPKESWAFISSCVYLIWIHAFTFNHIRNFGLAVGSIAGLLAISFTWYGVNYILGTGLHSYGFGKGGELYYYLFLLGEVAFLAVVSIMHSRSKRQPCAKK